MVNPTSSKDELGINYQVEQPYAYIGDAKWNLIPEGITERITDQLVKISEEFTKIAQSPDTTERQRLDARKKAAKQVLTLTLQKFSWTKAANDINIGPALLAELSGEVKDFLLIGGKVGMRRLQTRLDLARSGS